MKEGYGLKITTLVNASDTLSAELEYLCSLVESPDVEFIISDAVTYAYAVMCISSHLDYITDDLSNNELTQDQECVILTGEEVVALNSYTEQTEAALAALNTICGISLQNN